MRTKLEVLDNSVILYIDDIRLTASNPVIVTFDKAVYEDRNDILSFKYDLLLEKKNKLWWREISKATVNKFGIMDRLEEQINDMLNTSAREHGVRINYNKEPQESFVALYPYPIKGEYAEDAYIFTKYYKTLWIESDKLEIEYYDLDLMVGGDHRDKAAVGTHFMNLKRKDVEKIRDFGKEFMKIADRVWLEKKGQM